MSPPNAEDAYEGDVGPQRRRVPVTREGLTVKVEITSPVTGQTQDGYITANRNLDGTLGEVFLTGFGKSGSTLEGWTQFAAMLFSIGLQYGMELQMICRKTAHMKFDPYGKTTDPEIPWCNSVPDYMVRWLALHFGDIRLKTDMARIAEEMSTT